MSEDYPFLCAVGQSTNLPCSTPVTVKDIDAVSNIDTFSGINYCVDTTGDISPSDITVSGVPGDTETMSISIQFPAGGLTVNGGTATVTIGGYVMASKKSSISTEYSSSTTTYEIDYAARFKCITDEDCECYGDCYSDHTNQSCHSACDCDCNCDCADCHTNCVDCNSCACNCHTYDYECAECETDCECSGGQDGPPNWYDSLYTDFIVSGTTASGDNTGREPTFFDSSDTGTNYCPLYIQIQVFASISGDGRGGCVGCDSSPGVYNPAPTAQTFTGTVTLNALD